MKRLGKRHIFNDVSVELYGCRCKNTCSCGDSTCVCVSPVLEEPRNTTTAAQNELVNSALTRQAPYANNYQK